MSGRGWDGRIRAYADLGVMKPIPIHDRVIDLLGKGVTQEQVARCVGISLATVERHVAKAKANNEPIVKKFPAVIGVDL